MGRGVLGVEGEVRVDVEPLPVARHVFASSAGPGRLLDGESVLREACPTRASFHDLLLLSSFIVYSVCVMLLPYSNFKRWQQKMFFHLGTLNLAWFLNETAPQLRMERLNLGNSPTANIKGKGDEIGRSSRINDEVVQDQRQQDDNDLQVER
ncbi:hypothetical protein Tco_0685633 [Tanacetum coccineum]